MADAYAEIDQRFSLARVIPTVDVVRPGFQLERGGHPIMGLELIVARRLAVLMQIDKTWGYDQARGVNRSRPGELLGGHGADLAVLDSDIPHRIQPGLGIHHP